MRFSWPFQKLVKQKKQEAKPMETQLSLAKARLSELRSQTRDAEAQKAKADHAYSEELEVSRNFELKRLRIVEALAGSTELAKAKLHSELDTLDAALVASKRLVDSNEIAVNKINDRLALLHQERAEVEKIVQEEIRAEALQAFETELRSHSRAVEEHLTAAKEAMADLVTLAVQGEQRFELSGAQIAGMVIDQLRENEAQWQNRGWQLVLPGFKGLQFIVRPMKKV